MHFENVAMHQQMLEADNFIDAFTTSVKLNVLLVRLFIIHVVQPTRNEDKSLDFQECFQIIVRHSGVRRPLCLTPKTEWEPGYETEFSYTNTSN